MNRSRIPLTITWSILVFLYIPIIILVIFSFNESRFGSEWTGFSWKWYDQLFKDQRIWQALRNSLIIAVSATVASTVLGITAAFALHKFKTKWQKIHHGLIYTPLVIPDILMGISLLLFFVALNIQLGLFTIFIAHTTFCISYVTMVMLSRLQNFDYAIIEAAQDLGASPWTVFRRVTIPLIAPAMIAGALLAFTLSIDDFVITFFVAGQGTVTLPLYIYGMIKFGTTPMINALSTILLILTFIVVGLTHYLIEEEKA